MWTIFQFGAFVFLELMSRTPKYFDGTARTGKKISDLLPEVLGEIGSKAGHQGEEIFHFWTQLIGEGMAPLTQPVSFADGVLTVKVKSATLYSLLCQHEKPRLLKRLQEKFSIRNIIFRIG